MAFRFGIVALPVLLGEKNSPMQAWVLSEATYHELLASKNISEKEDLLNRIDGYNFIKCLNEKLNLYDGKELPVFDS